MEECVCWYFSPKYDTIKNHIFKLKADWFFMAVKYYAVQAGRSTGVFMSWAECQKQVMGFPGAVFKSFPTREEAEAFVEGKAPTVKESGEEIVKTEEGALAAYVDGSFHAGTGEFSYGMVILNGTEEITFFEKYHDAELSSMRNVAGEIKGAEAAMRYAVEKEYKKLYIYHDYEGIAKWCQGAWKANKEGTKAYKAYFDSIGDKLEVVFVKVAAHTGNKYNEMADRLAKRALGIE